MSRRSGIPRSGEGLDENPARALDRCLARTLTPARRAARRSLAALLARGIVSGGDADELVTLLGTALDVECLAVGQGFGFTPRARTFEVPAEWMRIHGELVHADPAAPFLERAPDGAIYHVLSDSAEQRASNEALRALARFGFADALVGILRSPLEAPVFFAFYRCSGSFDDDERAELALLQPALACALAARTALDAMAAPRGETRHDAVARVVAHLEIGLPGPHTAWSPGAAAAISRATRHSVATADLRRLERALLAIVRDPPVGVRSHRFVLGLRAEIAWIPPRPDEARRALVMLVHDRRPAIDTAHPLLEALSPRQRQAAIAAARGASLTEIGVELGISAETARSHLRAAYRVLGASNRAELAALLAR